MPDVYRKFDEDVATFGGYQYTATDRFSSRWANDRMTRATLESIPLEGRRVVDVGCGDGTYTAQLAARGNPALIVGLDPAEKAIDRASKSYAETHSNLRFTTGFSSRLVEQDERFDVAIYRGVIHHLDDPEEEISRAFRLASRVLFIEPNGLNPLLKILEVVSPYHREHEERSFSSFTLRRWVENSGGRVDATFYCGLVPFFSPDWYAKFAAAMEPLVEALPLVRQTLCAQVGIVASDARP